MLVSLLWAAGVACAATPAVPAGLWDAAKAEKLETSLDAFFAETDAGKRAELFKKEILPKEPGLALDDFERIAKAAPPLPGNMLRVQCPWAKENPRAWFNCSAPKGYTPAKAWGLVIALHGSNSDGNNMVPFYSPQLNDAGYFVLYPTTTAINNMWNADPEMANVYRIIDWAARNYRIDFRRLVITGASMGGMGTWSHLLEQPHVWSCGGSAAGHPAAMGGEVLENLRGIPFYILHGEKDTAGVSLADVKNVRIAVEELKKRNIDHVYVEAPGAGHTPPMEFFQAMSVWITKQAPKAWSPRPLFLPSGEKRALWQIREDRLGIKTDPALAMIKDGKAKEAKTELDGRLRSKDDPRVYLLRAMAQVPALIDPLPDSLDPTAMADAAKGWNAASENAALSDLDHALRSKAGKDDEKAFNAYTYLLIGKIWSKRFAVAIGAGGTGWVTAYQNCSNAIKASNQLDPAAVETARLAQAVIARLPLKRQ